MTSIRISSMTHRVKVIGEARADVAVSGDARIRVDGEQTTVDELRSRVTLRVPAGADLVIGTTSGRVQVEGTVGDVSVVTESGRIEIESVESADARTASGRVTLGRVTGDCRVRSESGRIEVGACAAADAATTSGRIELMHVSGPARAHCVSGRVGIELEAANDVDAETVSGRITVSLPPGTRVHRAEGSGAFELRPDGTDCTVKATSVSGKVEVSNR